MTTQPAGIDVSARTVCVLAVLGLLALQWVWPGRIFPDTTTPGLVIASCFSLPWALLALGLWRRRAKARFWAGVTALFYFCHGIAEAWAIPESRLPGYSEALLSVAVVVASSWDGLRARLGARAGRNV